MATTRDLERLVRTYIDPSVADNVYNSTPFLSRFRKKAKMRGGFGQYVEQPIEYATGLAGSYAELALMDRSRKEITITAKYYMAQYRSPLTVSWKDRLTWDSPEKTVDGIMIKARNAEKDLGRVIAADLATGDGTGSDGETTIIGLSNLLAYSGSATVAGLSQTSYTWWVPQSTNKSSATITIPDWVDMMAKCTDGSDAPTIAITDKYIWSYIWGNLLQPLERYTGGKYNMADNLPAVSGLPVLTDAVFESSGATGGLIYMINEDDVFMRVHSSDNFKRWPYEKPVDQYAFTTSWSWSGMLCAKKLKTSGVIYGVTTS